jgi:hypothetical protein
MVVGNFKVAANLTVLATSKLQGFLPHKLNVAAVRYPLTKKVLHGAKLFVSKISIFFYFT